MELLFKAIVEDVDVAFVEDADMVFLYDVDANQASNGGMMPLCMAIQDGLTEMLTLLLAHEGVTVNQTRNDEINPRLMASYKELTE